MTASKDSEAERAFITRWLQLSEAWVETPMHREYPFDKRRKWRFDFAFLEPFKVAVEIEGGVYLKRGGHTSPKGYEANCEKYNAAAAQGWVVLRYTPQMLNRDPESIIRQVCEVLRSRTRE